MRGRTFATAFLVMVLPTGVQAAISTNCGASSGYSYFLPGFVTTKENEGWQRDGLSAGQIVMSYSGGTVRLGYLKNDRIITPEDEGGTTMLAGVDIKKGEFLVLVVFPNVVEHYLFQIDAAGNGQVAWGTARIGTISKNSLYAASCSPPANQTAR